MADAATRAKLTLISESHIVIGAPSAIVGLDSDLKRGDIGENVGYLQEFLAYEGSYSNAIINQSFGPLTQQGVISFQKKYGVTPPRGYVGPKTRHTIQNALGL
jgi:peptidoglycan hydrolase-like protein with peptidoglycan-binding domain